MPAIITLFFFFDKSFARILINLAGTSESFLHSPTSFNLKKIFTVLFNGDNTFLFPPKKFLLAQKIFFTKSKEILAR